MPRNIAKKTKGKARQKTARQNIYGWLGIFNARAMAGVMLIIVTMITGISVVYSTHQNRYLFSELQELKSQHNNLQVEWEQLLIEQSTFANEGRIEKKAIEDLHMAVPNINEIVMVKND